MNPTPLNVVAGRAQLLIDQLLNEYLIQRYEARWPRAAQPGPITASHNTSDSTSRTAITPDPTNQARADRIERTLRRVYHELEDEAVRARKRSRKPCDTDGCTDPATRRGLCSACYEYQRRHGVPRCVRTAWKARA